jgi:hypothetical protein
VSKDAVPRAGAKELKCWRQQKITKKDRFKKNGAEKPAKLM